MGRTEQGSNDVQETLNVFLETETYCSIVSHVLKNAFTNSLGVVLGDWSDSQAICKTSFPLLHDNLINGPLLGVGFSLAEKWAQQKGLDILGLYFSHYDNSVQLPPHHQAIVSQLPQQGIKNPLVLMVDTNYLKTSECCVFWTHNSCLTPVSLPSGTEKILDDHISNQRHQLTYDLVDHTTSINSSPV